MLEQGMTVLSGRSFPFALAGFDPAIHVFFLRVSRKDVDPQVKPGGGEEMLAVILC
jgi:hypothetical protein